MIRNEGLHTAQLSLRLFTEKGISESGAGMMEVDMYQNCYEDKIV